MDHQDPEAMMDNQDQLVLQGLLVHEDPVVQLDHQVKLVPLERLERLEMQGVVVLKALLGH